MSKKKAMHLFVNSGTWVQMCASQLATPLSACHAHSCTLAALKQRPSHHGRQTLLVSMYGFIIMFHLARFSSEAFSSYATL